MRQVVIILLILSIILLLISIGDFLYFRIENSFIIAILVIYVIGCVTGITGNNILFGFIVSIICFIVGAILNYNNLLGGGDVKLIFALALFSEQYAIDMLFAVSVSGFVLALVYMIFNKKIHRLRYRMIHKIAHLKNNKLLVKILLPSAFKSENLENEFKESKQDILQQQIPYGIALCVGGFAFILHNLKCIF